MLDIGSKSRQQLFLQKNPVYILLEETFIYPSNYATKKPPGWAVEFGFYIDNWIYSGDDLLFRGLSQSTIGDTGFPCLVRDGTEGGSRSIITRINPANIIIQYRINI